MNQQKHILKLFEGNRFLVLTKKEIKEKSGIAYYQNTDKHLGDMLSRMVKNGSLIRISPGKFKLGSGTKMIVQPKNQTKLL